MLTKKDMAEIMINSYKWDGKVKNADELCRLYSKEEIKDMYDIFQGYFE